MYHTSKTLLKTLCTVLVLALAAGSAAAAEQPNVVLILADDVGIDAIGAYGGESYRTPHIDALAKGGLRFDHCYSMPVCHPTRITLLSGRYPFRLNNPGWGSYPKRAESQTIAHALQDAGYATAVAGKWQLALLKKDPHHPQRLGFQESNLFGWHEGPRYYAPMIYHNGEVRDDVEDRYGPDVYTNELIDFMERNKERPFFAFYSMALCHDVTDDLKEPVPYGPEGRYDTYREMVHHMDRCVGRITAALERLGLRERTLVLFTGDNGTPKSYIHSADENGKLIRKPVVSKFRGKMVRGGKGNLTNDGNRVPLIASWPGTIEPGQSTEALVDFTDFYATFVDMAGADVPKGVALDGRSFLPVLKGATDEGREWAFVQHRGKHFVRTTRYKLYGDGRFYDVAADPQERRPLKGDLDADARKARSKLQAALEELGVEGR